MPPNEFYIKLAKLRFVIFLIVGTLALAVSGWRHDWTDWKTIFFETTIVTFTTMILSLPLAAMRTKMKMDREARKKPSSTD